MTGIDTNVLVRHLVADEPRQADRVQRWLAECRSAGESVYISAVVLCEAVWVLRSIYGKPQAEILQVLEQLLEADVFQVEEPEAVERAIELSRRGKADFTDHLIGQLHRTRGCRATVTFDRALRTAADFRLL